MTFAPINMSLGKIIFGRSHVRDVALRRKDPISEYCKVGRDNFLLLQLLLSILWNCLVLKLT